MRGLYTSTYLETLGYRFGGGKSLDIGSGFDLIVGTSTGGILACGLAAGVSLKDISIMYQEHGPSIFPAPTPDLSRRGIERMIASSWKLLRWERDRNSWAIAGQTALRNALVEVLRDETVRQCWERRNIALCIPTVNMSNHKPWVFKTPHLPGKTRDNDYRLVDMCLATSAAPIFFPLAVTDVPEASHYNVFVDGGLWANNPVLIGLTEALQLACNEQEIQIISIGTCAPPVGRTVPRNKSNWGLADWKVGLEIVETSLDSQSAGYDFIASQIARHINRPCTVVRLPTSPPSGDQVRHVGLDKASELACKALTDLGRNDAETLHSKTMAGDPNFTSIKEIFDELSELN